MRLSANRRQGRIAQQLLAKMWQYSSLFCATFLFIINKVKALWKIFKTLRRFCSFFTLSEHNTFSQSQSRATVSLRTLFNPSTWWKARHRNRNMYVELVMVQSVKSMVMYCCDVTLYKYLVWLSERKGGMQRRCSSKPDSINP
jgi:hypothetical protein